jgi:hypothetical protein
VDLIGRITSKSPPPTELANRELIRIVSFVGIVGVSLIESRLLPFRIPIDLFVGVPERMSLNWRSPTQGPVESLRYDLIDQFLCVHVPLTIKDSRSQSDRPLGPVVVESRSS